MKNYYWEMEEWFCCPKFNLDVLNEKEIIFNNEMFVKDKVISFLHIPLNFWTVMTRNWKKIDEQEASPKDWLILSDENSLWWSDMYIKVTKNVKDCNNTTISWKFITKVYEWPYKDMKKWIVDMQEYIKNKWKELEKLYFFYTTCPKCAKKRGKNYVVIFAKIKE